MLYALTHGLKFPNRRLPRLTDGGSREIYDMGIGDEGIFLSKLRIRHIEIGPNWRCEGTYSSLSFMFEGIEPHYNEFLGTENSVSVMKATFEGKVEEEIIVTTDVNTKIPIARITRLSDSPAYCSVAWEVMREIDRKAAPDNTLLFCTTNALCALGAEKIYIVSSSLYELDTEKEGITCHILRSHLSQPPIIVKPPVR